MTQTTVERIETWQRVERMMDSMLVVEHSEPYPHEDGTMGGEYSDYVYDEDHKFRNLIAAEIDALRDEMAVILRERNDAHLALAEARAEVDGLAAQLSSADRSREATEDRLNRLESALAIAGIYPFAGDYAAAVYALHGDVIAVRAALDRAVGERDEARAEVERLRPAAEAWEARQAWYARGLDDENLRRLFVAMTDADSRAIAAKEAQP